MKVGDKIRGYDLMLRKLVNPGINNYKVSRIIERFVDEGIITEEVLLAEEKQKRLELLIHIIELKDEQALKLTLREIETLNQLDGHEHITTLLTSFRHRQYVALVLPAFTPLRDKIEYRIENKDEFIGRNGSALPFRKSRTKDEPWLFSSNAVTHVLQYVVNALDYMHKKNLVHTQLCANNVFMDGGGQVKLGGFSHARQKGSRNWSFIGDVNCYPPEALFRNDSKFAIHPSFDYWSLGLLTIELITGHREEHVERKCQRLAEQYLKGEKNPPSLAEISPNMMVDGQQTYDPNVDSWIAKLLTVNPLKRGEFSPTHHPFLKKNIHAGEARREWQIPVLTDSPFDDQRSLLQEMVLSVGSRTEMDADFLKRIIHSIRLVEDDFYPIFDSVPDAALLNDYTGIEASVAIESDDSEWSRDVLNVSRASSGILNPSFARTPDRPSRFSLTGENFDVQSNHPGLEKDYERHELCFFIKKSWSDNERQVFTALQFARWYHRGIIK